MKIPLHQIAHTHVSVQGPRINISVIAWNESDYVLLAESLSTGKVRMSLDNLIHGSILRYELPNISSLNFVYVQNHDGMAGEKIPIDIQKIADKFMQMEIEGNGHESEN